MTYRITERDLQGVVDTLNKVTGHPKDAWTKDDKGLYHSVVGCYVLSHAYGGVELQQICTDGGGVSTPIGAGHVTKRELYYKMHAYLDGLFDAGKIAKWELIETTTKYHYWKHAEGYYNCTSDGNPPTTQAGYIELNALKKLKGDH